MSAVWIITGYDGGTELFKREVAGILTDAEIATMLQRLASRHLTDDEVISASLRKNDSAHRSDLDIAVSHGGRYALMTTGSGAHYTAVRDERA